MKNFLSTNSAILLLLILSAGCKTMQDTTPARIGIQPLLSYTLTTPIPTDTAYRVFRYDDRFNASFKASANSSKRPDFNGQTVVAILLKKKPEQHALQFEKAEISGNTMNVYAQTCNPADRPTCTLSQVLLAATPKSGSVKKVQFFVNNISKSIVIL